MGVVGYAMASDDRPGRTAGFRSRHQAPVLPARMQLSKASHCVAYDAGVALTDTTDEAGRRQLDFDAATPGADKVLLASEMAEQAKQIAVEGIRSRNADLSEAGVHAAWLRLLHGQLAAYFVRPSAAETS